MSETVVCGLCGEPMPEGEEMFNYHGLSGPCPKPPLAAGEIDEEQMCRDFESIPDPPPGCGVMARARRLVEEHVERHGPIPKAESLIDEIAAEMGLLQLYDAQRRHGRG